MPKRPLTASSIRLPLSPAALAVAIGLLVSSAMVWQSSGGNSALTDHPRTAVHRIVYPLPPAPDDSTRGWTATVGLAGRAPTAPATAGN